MSQHGSDTVSVVSCWLGVVSIILPFGGCVSGDPGVLFRFFRAFPVLALPGLVLGIVGLVRGSTKRRFAIAGVVLSSVTLVLCGLFWVVALVPDWSTMN